MYCAFFLYYSMICCAIFELQHACLVLSSDCSMLVFISNLCVAPCIWFVGTLCCICWFSLLFHVGFLLHLCCVLYLCCNMRVWFYPRVVPCSDILIFYLCVVPCLCFVGTLCSIVLVFFVLPLYCNVLFYPCVVSWLFCVVACLFCFTLVLYHIRFYFLPLFSIVLNLCCFTLVLQVFVLFYLCVVSCY